MNQAAAGHKFRPAAQAFNFTSYVPLDTVRAMPPFRKLLSFLLLLTTWIAFTPRCHAATNAPVCVILWFDTEDYLLPASDDSAMRLANLLSEKGIKATFKVVGEKARVLKQRGRDDVIEALKKHDIAYHSDFHSVHPTPAEYLAEAGLEDGMRDFIRREMYGASDVRRIFGVKYLSCYGQPGSSWAPQVIAALRQIGVGANRTGCYVDEGSHIGLNEQPFWYCGSLVVYKMGQNVTRMDLHDPAALEPAKAKVAEMVKNLEAKGGGLISIYYHPCEWVHQEFWDGVNFRRGANPPRDQWKAPAQLPAAKTGAAFKQFEAYVSAIQALPVRFVTASDLVSLYPDSASTSVYTGQNTSPIREHILKGAANGKLSYYTDGKTSLSLADQFVLIATVLERKLRTSEQQKFTPLAPVLPFIGPEYRAATRNESFEVDPAQFTKTVHDVYDFLKFRTRIPAKVFFGAEAVGPAEFLVTAARVLDSMEKDKKAPQKIQVPAFVANDCEQYVAKDTPRLFGDWIIHKEGFQAPKLLEIARLQTWTLKPAILSSASR
jgi:hypothetical protein